MCYLQKVELFQHHCRPWVRQVSLFPTMLLSICSFTTNSQLNKRRIMVAYYSSALRSCDYIIRSLEKPLWLCVEALYDTRKIIGRLWNDRTGLIVSCMAKIWMLGFCSKSLVVQSLLNWRVNKNHSTELRMVRRIYTNLSQLIWIAFLFLSPQPSNRRW